MLADRDDDERGLLKAILRLKGFRVVEAADGLEAIRLAQLERPDLMVVDLALPRVALAMRRVKRHSTLKHLPVVTVSAKRRSPWQRQLAQQSSMHLSKPVPLDGFCEFIEGCLSRRQSQ
jgi:CheY-like chemotaxis protein